MANSPNPVPAVDQMVNGVKFIGNMAVLPGKGVLYGVTGVAASVIAGPLGWIVTGLDSYSLSTSGKHLWELYKAPSVADSPSPAQQ